MVCLPYHSLPLQGFAFLSVKTVYTAGACIYAQVFLSVI